MLEAEYLISVLNIVEKELDKQTEERIIKLEGAKELMSILRSRAQGELEHSPNCEKLFVLYEQSHHMIANNDKELNEKIEEEVRALTATLRSNVNVLGRLNYSAKIVKLADGYSSVIITIFSDDSTDLLNLDKILEDTKI